MIKDSEVYKIGVLTKTHGVNGEVALSFTDDVFDRVECDYLVVKLDGILVPFYFEEYRFKNNEVALFKFERLDSSEAVQFLLGSEVYFPLALAEEAEEGELTWGYFVGMTVKDEHAGVLGVIEHVDETTINTLFQIDGPKGELLIPAQEDFILDIDHKKRVILMDLPEGLLDL
ncbi:MAG: ribosome maturation factor RimM [Bacteroidales bacterium]|nr:ribosome maturation factor RimM [Bacteroidales bacterium]